MELRLVEYFADEFNKQVGNGIDVRKSPKSMAKLKKQVKRTKEILSANTMAPISIESIYDDRDFKYVKLRALLLFNAVLHTQLSYCSNGVQLKSQTQLDYTLSFTQWLLCFLDIMFIHLQVNFKEIC